MRAAESCEQYQQHHGASCSRHLQLSPQTQSVLMPSKPTATMVLLPPKIQDNCDPQQDPYYITRADKI
jgi:hypothetical protein